MNRNRKPMKENAMSAAAPVAVVTGASRGLGLALTRALAENGWTVVVDGRDPDALHAAVRDLPSVLAVPGDVTDPAHRHELVDDRPA